MRYSRQELFSKIGKEGQGLIRKSTVAIVGLGALGSSSAELLTRAGIGKLKIIDRDVIEENNLQRQSLYTEEDIGKVKAETLKKHLKEINSEVQVEAFVLDLDYKNVEILESNLVLDCSDNMDTRYLINEYCVKNNIKWIHASVIGDKGYVLVINKGACFKCVFDKVKSETLGSCETEGVLNTIVKVISGMQVNECLKILTEQEHTNELVYYNIWKQSLDKIKIKKREDCEVCNGKYEYLEGKKGDNLVKLCGREVYQIKGRNLDIKELHNKLKGSILSDHFLVYDRIMIFKEGRAFIKAKNDEEAKKVYSQFVGN
ncbi:MAG: ThiF family adenylyltransferase [Candidatus Woesearchaeota archaeon]|nr:MAG: ThiF family adenylyltransferase [Candidatus Woesearchaeota archaeon]